ncbi:MAG: hypothetical protein ABIO70_05995 [Pseudomonadota bacterium]
MRVASMSPLLLALGLAGCAGGFDGTWLLYFDPQPVDEQGSCVDEDATTTLTGTSYQLIDIYTNGANGIVVLMEDLLSGTVDGSAFTASYQYVEGDIDREAQYGVDMTGELEKRVLSGEVTVWVTVEVGDTIDDCATTWAYDAELIDSDPESYLWEEQ